MTPDYNIIVEQEHTTVVARFTPEERDNEAYQSEAQLEESLLKQLCAQGYERPKIKDEAGLIANLRTQLEKLNDFTFSDKEWERLFDGQIANDTLDIEAKTTMIQQEHILNLILDDGTTKNIKLIDKQNIHNNHLQVINQYVPEGGSHANRYDVTILVNGLPLVHVELKKRGGSIREAFNQINRYQRESFWAGKALFEYVQVFVITNGTQTKYYSNTTRFAREQEAEKQRGIKKKTESNSFEFTSYWSDAENQLITDLEDFAETFLAKHTLLNILTKYCVFTVDKNLLVMRPYQIAATEKILLRIQTALYNKWQGTTKAGGYIWHTTGSGKTLTSFKTAQLATKIAGIDKVLFVVDRQDLDYQTMKEYDNFEKDCANGNSNSNVLLKQLNDPQAKIIITTIQKLSGLVKRKKDDIEVLGKNVVMIFDECHRSQFGLMHQMVVKKFKKYLIFGFTGTPIFAVNAGQGKLGYSTTAQVFGGELDEKDMPTRPLHTYTIVNAINDKNVLKFKVDYVRTVKAKNNITDEEVWGIDDKKAIMDEKRITNNVAYILKNFDLKTKRSESFAMSRLINVSEVIRKGKKAEEQKGKVNVKGFNSILAADSVPLAIKYYDEFKKQIDANGLDLKIATIYTFAQNEAESDDAMGIIEEDPDAVTTMDATSKEALERAIKDYNAMFGTSYDTSGDKFQNYYKDVSLRMKNKEIDLLIVVGMFLTGFDAKTLNTLWVDKNLKMHGLLQAYSRTNRILNAVKDCGNIVCFRNLEEQTNDCFKLFGDRNAGGVILMRPFKDYYEGYCDENGKYHPGYKDIAQELLDRFDVNHLSDIMDEKQKKDFIRLFGNYLRAFSLLTTFDEFNPDTLDETNAIRIIKEGERQDYLSWYNDLYEEIRGKGKEGGPKTEIDDDLEFEIELVKQIQIDITYILALVQKYHDSNCQDKEIVLKIRKEMGASPDMRNKKDLIERFIERMSPSKGGDVYAEWQHYVDEQKNADLQNIIDNEQLKPEETREFVTRAFEDGYINENGTAVTRILPPMPLFGGGGKRAEKKNRVIQLLKDFFAKYFDLTDGIFTKKKETKIYDMDEENGGLMMVAEKGE